MAGTRTPGALCGSLAEPLDSGTMCRWLMPPPGPLCRVPEPPQRRARNQSVVGGYPPVSMVLGPEGVALLKAVETLRLKPYDDQTSKDITAWIAGATIGYGHLIPVKQ
jgi:hypothetical protein